MMNRWGNDDHGPGGDPSWLGGQDRDLGRDGGAAHSTEGADGWSSDFSSDSQRPDTDFSRSDSDFGSSREQQSAEQMAPRFGDVTGDEAHASGSEPESPWMASFTGQDAGGSKHSGPTAGKAFAGIISIFAMVILGFAFIRFSGHGFGAWWVLIFIFPLINRAIRMIRKSLGS